MNAFTDLIGIEHPIVQGGPFGGGLSTVELLATVSDGGGLGSFGGAHVLHGSAIIELVAACRARTSRPFNINLWVPQSGQPTDLSSEDMNSSDRSTPNSAPSRHTRSLYRTTPNNSPRCSKPHRRWRVS